MTTAKSCFCTAAALAAVLALGRAQGHHSYAAFDRCTPLSLEGEILSVEWVNPHIRIYLRTADVSSYFVEWFSLEQMTRAGLAAGALQAGDRVVVTGNPMRDTSKKVLSLLAEIRRPSDDWIWQRATAPQLPAGCTAAI